MTLSFNEFYQYVFGTFSQIEINAQVPENKRKELFAKRKEAIQNKFKLITDNTDLSPRFRGLLRELNNQELEDHLYGNHTEQVEPTPFPQDEIILEHFESLDQQYGYFAQNKTAKERFITFFKACKLIADFDEMNNTEHDSLAYEHAYKILVLTDSKHILDVEKFFEKYSDRFKNGKPIHDILVLAIPKNDPPIHLAGWQKLIRATGFKAITLFQRASDIEKVLDQNKPRAPNTILEAEAAASQLSYKRAGENPEFATLCERYNVEEISFNKCLDIKPKTSDLLPNVSIDGQLVGHPGYYLVKLPVNDPRAFILGHITNCCQSIGGDSEQCVIDGITRAHNGFYVLLEGKPSDAAPPIINGAINYDHYTLVGQAYAWLSQKDNLTFDSWENLTPSVCDKIIVPLLQQFGEHVTQQEHSRILRVTIGTGGKTPDSYSDILPSAEVMVEGYSYGDAKKQSLVYLNQNKINRFQFDLQQKHQKDWTLGEITTIQQLEQLKNLFIDEKNIQYYKNALEEHYENFLMHCLKNASFLWIASVLDKLQLLSKDHCHRLIDEEAHAQGIADTLSSLSNTNPSLVNDENFKLLTNQAQYAEYIARALNSLYKINPLLVNDENFKLLTNQAPYAESIAKAIDILYQINPLLLNDEMVEFLIHRAQNAVRLAEALKTLYKTNPSLINNENRDLLSENQINSGELAEVLIVLYKAYPLLLNDENRSILDKHAEEAWEIAQAIDALYITNSLLMNNENFKFLANQAQNAGILANGLITLYKTDPLLVNDENCDLLGKHAKDASMIAEILSKLYKANPLLLSDENRALLDKHAQNVWEIAQALIRYSFPLDAENFKLLVDQAPNAIMIAHAVNILNDIEPALVNDENRAFLGEHAEYAVEIAYSFHRLYITNPSLLNKENCTFLGKYAKDTKKLAYILCELYKVSPSLVNEKNRTLLGKHTEYMEKLASGLIKLYTTNPALLNDKNRIFLDQHAGYAWKLAKALSKLYKTNPSLANDENYTFLGKHVENAKELAYVLSELYKVDSSLVNDGNRALLGKYVEDAEAIAYSLTILYKINPGMVNDENRALLDEHAKYAYKIAQALKILYDTAPSLLMNNETCKLLINQASKAPQIASDLIREYQRNNASQQEKIDVAAPNISNLEEQKRIKSALQEGKKIDELSKNKMTSLGGS